MRRRNAENAKGGLREGRSFCKKVFPKENPRKKEDRSSIPFDEGGGKPPTVGRGETRPFYREKKAQEKGRRG